MIAKKSLGASIFIISILFITTWGFSHGNRNLNPSNSYNDQIIELKSISNGNIEIKMDELLDIPYFISSNIEIQGNPSLDSVRNFIGKYDKIFKIENPFLELKLISDVVDDLGMQHIKLQRIHENIPVYGSQLITHFDENGNLYCINGRYHPSLYMDTNPTIDVFTAIDISIQALFPQSQLPFNSDDYYTYSTSVRDELVIYPHENNYFLAYKIGHPLSFDENSAHEWRFFIDAKTGEILSRYDNLKSDGPILSNAPDMWNNQRTLNTYLFNGFYYMIDATKAMFKSVNAGNLYDSKGVIITVDYRTGARTDPFYYISTMNNKNWDKIAVSAHCNLGESYLFVNSSYNRNSFDGNGESIRLHIHYEKNLVNAYWSDSMQGFLFGDGDGNQSTYLAGAQDVVTHEFTHGITSYTCNLEYAFQPGALNESFSDMLAVVHDNDDWLLGEEVWTPKVQGDALRSMENPNLFDQPKTMGEYQYLNENQDNGGVHINSGIPNYTFYLFAKELGRQKAGQIAFRGFTLYLTQFSQFIDAREACIHAAADLYGKDSNEVKAVMNAFQTVGIGSGDLPNEDCEGIDEIEPNDSIDIDPRYHNPQPLSGSNPIILCGEITLGTNDGQQYKGDYDFYEITATGSGILKANLNWNTKASDLDLYLLDINKTKLAGGAGATESNPENLQFFLEKGKKYYLLVVSWKGKSEYKLTVSIPESEGWDCQGVYEIPEPNDNKMTDIAGQGVLTGCGNLMRGGYNYDTDEYTGDWDWYYYHLTQPGLVQFVLDWDNNADLDFFIGDNDGNLISGILGITIDKPEMITMRLTPGYYLIAVLSFDNPANFKLTIRQPGFVTEGCQGFWETEPNDKIDQAEEVSGHNPIDICGNSDWPGDGNDYGDFDLYKLVPDAAGVATFRLFWDSNWDYDFLVIRLYPTQYELIGFGEDKSEEQNHIKMIKANVFKDAEYYIAVAPWIGASDYSVRIDITGNEKADIQEVEPNNGLNTAQLIDGISPMIINGSITSFQNTNEIDLFKTKVITAELGASMYAQADWTGNGNLDMYVIEINGAMINFVSKNFGATQSNPEGVFVELPPGKEYYLGLICWDGNANYKIHLGFPFGY